MRGSTGTWRLLSRALLRRLPLLLTALWLQIGGARAGELLMPREPALSPDGRTLVVRYAGELWRAELPEGAEGLEGPLPAERLTAHPAIETSPVISPCGTLLATSGNDTLVKLNHFTATD